MAETKRPNLAIDFAACIGDQQTPNTGLFEFLEQAIQEFNVTIVSQDGASTAVPLWFADQWAKSLIARNSAAHDPVAVGQLRAKELQYAGPEPANDSGAHIHEFTGTWPSLAELYATAATDPVTDDFIRGVQSVLSTRCLKHANEPQLNANKEGGGECGICAVEKAVGEALQEKKEPLEPTFEFLSPASPVITGMEDAEVVYAKNQPEYLPLHTLPSPDRSRRVLSRWALTPAQRDLVSRGGDIYLELMTFGDPLQPIRMAVGYNPPAAFIVEHLWADSALNAVVKSSPVPGPANPPKPPGREVG